MHAPLTAALRKALILAAALMVAPAFAATESAESATIVASAGKKAAKPKAASAARSADKKQATGKQSGKATKAAKKAPEDTKPGPLADFGKEEASEDVVHVANWVSYTHNAKNKAFVLIDKKQARLYVFDPKGKLKSHSPILLGKAIGDHTVPGIGTKPLSQVKEDEKTTPAGRFLAQPGKNSHGEDIIWIDYNAAVSMHRMRKVKEEEKRAERMATPDVSDNRISYGCVNVPPAFYNSVLRPTVTKFGAYVYVLPETKTAQQQFGSFDVANKAEKVAQASDSAPAASVAAKPAAK
jgi:hypothetical protein